MFPAFSLRLSSFLAGSRKGERLPLVVRLEAELRDILRSSNTSTLLLLGVLEEEDLLAILRASVASKPSAALVAECKADRGCDLDRKGRVRSSLLSPLI